MATQQEIERYLPEAIERVYGYVADCVGGRITAWRHQTLPQPEPAAVVDEHLVYLGMDRPRREMLDARRARLSAAERAAEAAGTPLLELVAEVLQQLAQRVPAASRTPEMAELLSYFASAPPRARGR